MPFCKSKQVQTKEDRRQERNKLEENLISYYDLRPAIDFHVFDVPVVWQGKEYTIHTFKGGDLNQATLVLFHGYGGSNVHYSKVYKELIKYFRVISIDLPGMGFSSKADIKIETFDEVVTYYTEVLELWRKEMNIQSFCLAGHSFGGYIAALYALHYPQFIDQLFLLSPAGSTTYTEEEKIKLQDFSDLNFMKQWAVNYARRSWEEQTSIQSVGKRWYGNFMLKGYLKNRLKLQGKELDLWVAYKKAMIQLPEGSEKALFILFDFPKVIPKRSIQDMFSKNKLTFPITFYYGVQDWMDSLGATRLTKAFPQEIHLRKIDKAGHQLSFENPILLAQYIVDDYFRQKDMIKLVNLKGLSGQELIEDDEKLDQMQPHFEETTNLIKNDEKLIQMQPHCEETTKLIKIGHLNQMQQQN